MRKLKASIALLAFVGIAAIQSPALSQPAVENAIFWEVTGNELKEPSWIFGTFHLEGSNYANSLTVVMDRFSKARTFAGEIVFDNSMTETVIGYTLLKDTTLEMLLGENGFRNTSQWFRELTGVDMTPYNKTHPVAVQMVLLTALQKKIFPDESEPMDIYFQRLAVGKKKLIGLETLEQQLHILFNSGSLKSNADRLLDLVTNRDSVRDSLVRMNDNYHNQNITALYTMMKSDTAFAARDETVLFERNISWLQKILALFREQSTFVAVGALHLPGEAGLVTLLRQHGYTVKPLPLR